MVDATIQFQSYSKEYQGFRSLMALLHENGYSSLAISPIKQILNNLSKLLSANVDEMTSALGGSGEILKKEEPEILLFLKQYEGLIFDDEKGQTRRALEISCFAPDEETGRLIIKEVTKIMSEKAKMVGVILAWENVSQQESRLRISKMVKGLSTNGKLLANGETKEMCKLMRNETYREILSRLIQLEAIAFPVDSIDYLQKTLAIKNKTITSAVKSLVDCGAVSPIIRLSCPSCRTVSSGFSVSVSLKELGGKIFCSECGRPYDLKQRIEAFSVSSNARKAIEQGLWLEECVANVLTDLGCMQVHVGVMVDGLEIDEITIKHGEIILVECKAGDVDFTDLTIFSHKVRAINPDRAMIITTSKVLPNAKKEIEAIKKREEIEIVQIEGDLRQIEKKLEKVIQRIEEKYRKKWISSIFSGMLEHWRYERLGTLRLPPKRS